jgi:protoporphyrin/coproporphyrin ferrochelatase
MKGILLVSMGSPSSEKELRSFLLRMFQDASILPFPKLIRNVIAFIISRSRYKKSWKKYELIGGSPLKKSMNVINAELLKEAGNKFISYNAYSYDKPLIKDSIKYMYDKGVKKIKVIPMYPHYSTTTTGSVIRDIIKARAIYKDIDIKVADEFFENQIYIKLWHTLISETIQKNNMTDPILLFSAHSIPENQSKEDSYLHAIKSSAFLISKSLALKYKISYQSKMGKVKWVGPDTKDILKQLNKEGFKEIVLVPISFMNENLETLYDLDIDIIPYAKDILRIEHIYRVMIPNSHPLIIELIRNIIR